MEEIHATLEPLFRDFFHVVPISTFRHDQSYKRCFQHSDKAGREQLILSPTQSREEWIPHVQLFAAKFSQVVKDAARDRSKQPRALREGLSLASSDSKLFQDDVLDAQATAIFPGFTRRRALHDKEPGWYGMAERNSIVLTPAMQRIGFWTTGQKKEQERADAIATLLITGQIGPLLYLARHDSTYFAHLAPVNPEPGFRERDYNSLKHWNASTKELVGWKCVLGDVLEILFFIEILRCFPGPLVAEKGYERWIPVRFQPDCSSIGRWIDSHAEGKITLSTLERESGQVLDQCFVSLGVEHLLSDACGLEQDLEQQVTDWFLYFLGFECINRERAGQGYLACDMNTAKNAAWMHKVSGQKGQHDSLNVAEEKRREGRSPSPRPLDPLKLRAPKAEIPDEMGEEELAELHKLAVLEAEEDTYGRKRSSKYQRKR